MKRLLSIIALAVFVSMPAQASTNGGAVGNFFVVDVPHFFTEEVPEFFTEDIPEGFAPVVAVLDDLGDEIEEALSPLVWNDKSDDTSNSSNPFVW